MAVPKRRTSASKRDKRRSHDALTAPHVIAFARSGTWSEEPGPKRMVVGTAHTRPFTPAEIGRMPQIVETARAVAELARELRLDPADVHLVQMKGAIPHADHEAAQAAANEITGPNSEDGVAMVLERWF